MQCQMDIASISDIHARTRSRCSGISARATSNASVLPALSIIVPTRNEAGNVTELVRRLEQSLPDRAIEIIFVDDSDDDTCMAIQAIHTGSHCSIQLIHRPPDGRAGGLGGAVIVGMRAARAPWACVMDADLQHPPELVPRLLRHAQTNNLDLAIASRYCNEGRADGLAHLRTAVSRSSTMAARLLFPHRLAGVTDPMSGFFLVRKDALALDGLQPQGFKILLEILARSEGLRIGEVGFVFGQRHAGESKASLREGMRYLSHLGQLRFGQPMLQFALFLLVGLSGLLVNSLALAAATEIAGLYYLFSAALATEVSSVWNFTLSEAWVFADRRQPHGWAGRLTLFLVVNNAALFLRGPLIYGLTNWSGLHYLASNLLSLVAFMLVRYGVADRLIWRRK